MTLTPQAEEVNAVRNSTTYEWKLYAVMEVGRKTSQISDRHGLNVQCTETIRLATESNNKADSVSTHTVQRNKDDAPWEDDCDSDKPKNKQAL